MATDKEARKTKFAQLGEVIRRLEARIEELETTNEEQLDLLTSVSQGTYEEIEKLCKKAPAESVTDLALAQINDVIRETKQLAQKDTFVQRLNEFVPAGDNPELRDALMVMRQIRQGLQRYALHLSSATKAAKETLREALFVHVAVALHLDGKATDKDSLQQYQHGDYRSDYWMIRRGVSAEFSFARFDSTDLESYFG